MSERTSQDDILQDDEAAGLTGTDPDVSVAVFDEEKYLPELADADLTEEQKIAMLQALWSIMQAFVDLGFGVNSIHSFFPEIAAKTSEAEAVGVESGNGICRENFEDAADSLGAEDGDS